MKSFSPGQERGKINEERQGVGLFLLSKKNSIEHCQLKKGEGKKT